MSWVQKSSQLLAANDLVPVTFQVAILKFNSKAYLNVLPCLKACKIIGDILKKHPLKDALTLSAPSLFIYMQQLWYTISRALDEKEVIRFKIDRQKLKYTNRCEVKRSVGQKLQLQLMKSVGEVCRR
ncbi:hypothetical protein Tco_0015930 [Tanacetum coccineum]